MFYINKFNKVRSEYGVGEWAGYSYNIGVGCEHNCLYCYARADAFRYGNICKPSDWGKEKVNIFKQDINAKVDKRVMFPSTHDITPNYLNIYLKTLKNILKAGNEVLLVSKPNVKCIEKICDKLTAYKDKMEFRFTIGTLNEQVSKFWEPGAPLPDERIEALNYAFNSGYKTSVSIEPMLEGYEEAHAVFRKVETMVNKTIWIGLMNLPRQRVDVSIQKNKDAVDKILELQTDENIMKLYRELKDEPKVRWKDSIRKVIKRRIV